MLREKVITEIRPFLLFSSALFSSSLLYFSPLYFSVLYYNIFYSSSLPTPLLSHLPFSIHPLSLFLCMPPSPALPGSTPSFFLCGWMNVTGLHTKQAGSLALGRAQRLNRITHIHSPCHSEPPAPRGPVIETPRRPRA